MLCSSGWSPSRWWGCWTWWRGRRCSCRWCRSLRRQIEQKRQENVIGNKQGPFSAVLYLPNYSLSSTLHHFDAKLFCLWWISTTKEGLPFHLLQELSLFWFDERHIACHLQGNIFCSKLDCWAVTALFVLCRSQTFRVAARLWYGCTMGLMRQFCVNKWAILSQNISISRITALPTCVLSALATPVL